MKWIVYTQDMENVYYLEVIGDENPFEGWGVQPHIIGEAEDLLTCSMIAKDWIEGYDGRE